MNNKLKTRKFAWVALVLALAMVGGPVVAQQGPVMAFPDDYCPPHC